MNLNSIILLVLCSASAACSQVPRSNQSKNTPSPPAESSAGPLKVVGHASANYSPRVDQTEGIIILDLTQHSPQVPNGQGLSMMAHFSVPGKGIKQPENLYLGFDSSSPRLKYRNDHKLTIFCEGRECFSGETRIMHAEENARGANETMQSPPIPYKEFLRIVESGKVSIQLGQTRIELKREELEGLRDLKRLIEQ